MPARRTKSIRDWMFVVRVCVVLACMHAILLIGFAIKCWPCVPTINGNSPGNYVEVLKSMDGPPSGAGEKGKPVYLDEDDEFPNLKLIRKQMFNVVVSNKISYNRSIPDNRDKRCAKIAYDADLPTASVIIPFHNEAWSGLMRTLWTVVIRSPAHLLREVLLVDDFSDTEELGEKLDSYVMNHFRNVRVIRSKWRRWTAGARDEGAKAASGEVLVFLESLCEAGHKWLEPLLQKVKYGPNNIAVPWIDEIDHQTLEYRQHGPEYFGNFMWGGNLSWQSHLVQKENFDKLSPSDSKGIFAISRKRFWEIHAADKADFDLSFRLWMCDGTFEFIPCSRVGRVARNSPPHLFDAESKPLRFAERWIYNFKHLIYNRDEYWKSLKDIKHREIRTKRALKEKLHCEYFHWYIDKIFPQESLLEEASENRGKIINRDSLNCVDTLMSDPDKHEPIGLYQCVNISEFQVFTITSGGEIRFKLNFCFDVFGENATTVVLSECKRDKDSQAWTFYKSGCIVHSATSKCLNENEGRLEVNSCKDAKAREWGFESDS